MASMSDLFASEAQTLVSKLERCSQACICPCV